MVFFWDPECGHCGKVSDKLIEYYDNFKKYGLEVFGICTKSADELKRCNEKATEKKMRWTNYADPYYLAKAKMLYDIKTTPGIFLLDKDKKIILKKFEMDDLKRFFEAEEKKAPSTPAQAPKKGK
jgi:peroxiredoxin